MEEKDLESAIKFIRVWHHPTFQQNLEAFDFAARAAQLVQEAGVYSAIKSMELAAERAATQLAESEWYEQVKENIRAMSQTTIWVPFGEFKTLPQTNNVFYIVMADNKVLELDASQTENKPIDQGENAEAQAEHIIQTAIAAVERIRLAMKQDEQEIARIQASTQQLLDKLKVA